MKVLVNVQQNFYNWFSDVFSHSLFHSAISKTILTEELQFKKKKQLPPKCSVFSKIVKGILHDSRSSFPVHTQHK